VDIEKGLDLSLDQEAVRVISAYDKKWEPGLKNGKPVNTKMILPITFKLDGM
jgi:hypothetical protein